jgi:iron complex transport system substrate-binding protein
MWLLLLLMVAVTCRADDSQAPIHGGQIQIIDDLGEQVALPGVPMRIVSLAPSNTEILYAIGAGDRVVGVTQWCNYPEAAQSIQQVAGYADLNVERITAVSPDLILAARGNDLEGLETLKRMGIPVFALNVQSLESMVDAVTRLGQLTGTSRRADSLGLALRQRLAVVDQRILKRVRPRVLWGYVAEPVYTAGPGSLIDDVIHRAGGLNVARAAEGTWPQVSLETIVAWAPEVLLTSLGKGMQPAGEIERLLDVDGWKDLPAIRDGRIVNVDGDLLTRAGPRLVDAVEILSRALHPSTPAPR